MTDTALLLAGGYGSRLGRKTRHVAKPALQVAGKPFIRHLAWNLYLHGVTHLVVSVGYKPHTVAAALEGVPQTVEYLVEDTPRGTGYAVLEYARQRTNPFFVLNGDTLSEVDYRVMDRVHQQSRVDVTVATTRRGTPVGSYLFDPAPLRYLGERGMPSPFTGRRVSLEKEVLPRLSTHRTFVPERHLPEGFLDIGSDYRLGQADELVRAWRHRPAVLFDRDGVLNVDHGHVGSRERFEWTLGAITAIRLAQNRGFRTAVVTNQAGIGKGLYSEEAFVDLTEWMQVKLASQGTHLDAVLYCPMHSEGGCRKPSPDMLTSAIHLLDADHPDTILVGDKGTDLEAAEAAGIRGYLYRGGRPLDEVLSEAMK